MFGYHRRLLEARMRVLQRQMEGVMATLTDVTTAFDAFDAKLNDAVTKIEGEVAVLKTGTDLQPVVDKLNAAGAVVDALVAAVVPTPPAG